MIYKGLSSDVDSYSSFYDNLRTNETRLRAELLKNCVTDVFVCGLATDVCVGEAIATSNLNTSATSASASDTSDNPAKLDDDLGDFCPRSKSLLFYH